MRTGWQSLVAVTASLLTATPTAVTANTAHFAWIDYAGVASGPAPRPGVFRDPVRAGHYSDPSGVSFRRLTGEEAGLVAVRNVHHFLSIAVARERDGTITRAARRAGLAEPPTGRALARKPVPGGPIELRLHARGARCDLAYRTPGGQWRTPAADVDGTNLSGATAGGLVGTLMEYAQFPVGATPRPAPENPDHLDDTVDGAT